MSYKINKKNGQYFVQNAMTGRVLGHHKTKKEAQSQVSAVNTTERPIRSELKKSVSIHMSGNFAPVKGDSYDIQDGIN